MTREEIVAFVREAVESEWRMNRNTRRDREEVIEMIADKWEEETDAAYTRGVHVGQETWDPNFME
jgi:nuclear transport factor 2 (NTF2) superfamily protein